MQESVFIGGFIMGVTEFLRRIESREFHKAIIIVVAAIVGAVAGFFGVEGLTPVSGMLAGFSAAGIFRLGQAVSGR